MMDDLDKIIIALTHTIDMQQEVIERQANEIEGLKIQLAKLEEKRNG